MKFAVSFWSLLIAGAAASNVLDLVPDTWDDVIGKGKPGLVEFFAPWCGHCKNLAPTYEQLADAFAHKKDKVVIAKVDADGEGRPLGQQYGVTGFPTLKWFDGEGNAEPYDGARDLDALAAFVSQKSGVKSNIKPPPPPATLILDTHTFDDVVLNPEHDTIVAFTAPWCGHCKKLKPTYEEVAKDFALEKNCIVANVDADAEANRPLATRYGVASYPTLKFFPKGGEPVAYEGARTEAAFVEFLNEKCGTHRTPGGALNDLAGRLPDFDEIASKFYSAEESARQTILAEAAALADTVGPAAKQYLKVMEKVVNGTGDYLEKESKRLSSILAKRTMAPAKLDELKIKANILAAFAEKKVEEVVEEITNTDEVRHEEL